MCRFAGFLNVFVWIVPFGRIVHVTSRNGFDFDGGGARQVSPSAGKLDLKFFQSSLFSNQIASCSGVRFGGRVGSSHNPNTSSVKRL